jgi:hypothetical protein
MWDPPGTTIGLRIKALDQGNLSRCLLEQVMPLVSAISTTLSLWPNTKGLTLTVGIDEFDRNKLIFIDGVCSNSAQGIFENGLDWTPDIDDLDAALEERLGLLRKMMGNARKTSLI